MIGYHIRERMAGRWFRVAISTFASVGPMMLYLADKILVVRDGRIVEEGTHAGPLQTGGVYSELYRTQYGKELAA